MTVTVSDEMLASSELTARKPSLSFPGESVQAGQDCGRAQPVLAGCQRAAGLDDRCRAHAGFVLPPHVGQECAGRQDAQAGGVCTESPMSLLARCE